MKSQGGGGAASGADGDDDNVARRRPGLSDAAYVLTGATTSIPLGVRLATLAFHADVVLDRSAWARDCGAVGW